MGATTVAVVSGAIMVASSVAEGMGNYGEQKRLEKINKYNAAVTAEKIKSLNYEEAMNDTLRRLNAYRMPLCREHFNYLTSDIVEKESG